MLSSSSVGMDSMPDVEHFEQRHVREFLEFFSRTPGYFVDVGANQPFEGSQSWPLERRGWHGVLVEPMPDLAAWLREARQSPVFAVACSSPENASRSLPFYVAGGRNHTLSSLSREGMAPGSKLERIIEVPVRTLDDILIEAEAPQPIDFLSVDVESHEAEVLRGFDFGRWHPRLILIEDHVPNLRLHRLLRSNGYRLVRRTIFNGCTCRKPRRPISA